MRKTTLFLFLYAGLVLLGGVIGYAQAKSIVSLSLGLLFGSLLAISATLAIFRPLIGYVAAFFLCVALQGVFTWRFAKTLQIFPSGVFGFLTLVLLSVLAFRIQKLRRYCREH